MRIDLHTHSDASDGTRPPAEVVRRAREAGLDVLALTDHDTVAGWDEARAALPEGLALVPGIELSCRYEGRSLHLLGYLFDPDEPELAGELARIRAHRLDRARGMVDRLRALGADVAWERVRALSGGEVVGRPHVARAMVEAGVVATVDEAFTPEWIGSGGRAHVGPYPLDPVRAVRLVREAGGACVLAHPRAGRRGYVLGDEVIEELAAAGLAGLETDHPDHAPEDRARLRALAAGLGLLVTGASDDHGEMSGDRLGCETTSREDYEALLSAAPGGGHPGPAFLETGTHRR